MPNPSALILPMEPQPPEGTNLIEWNMVNKAFVPWEWERGPTYSGGSRTGKPIHCQHRIGDKVKAGDKTLLVRTVEARRVDSLTEEEAELCGIRRFARPHRFGAEVYYAEREDAELYGLTPQAAIEIVLARHGAGQLAWVWFLKGEVVNP